MNTEVLKRLRDDYAPINMEARYDDMLNECYSFESVGGLFKYFLPSKVLQEMDETAYRCGFNDWLDSERQDSVFDTGEDEYYDLDEARKAYQDVIDELDAQRSDLEQDLEENDADIDSISDEVESIERTELQERSRRLEKEIAALNNQISALEKEAP